MNYYFEDFTEDNYQYLLKKYIKERESIFFNDIFMSNTNSILLRHDIDISVHRAYKMALIEKNLGIKSTYFVQMSSCFYNIFEKNIYQMIKKILILGHQVGLHYDCEFDIKVLDNQEKFEADLKSKKNILSSIIEENILSFSFHNPTEEILNKFCDLSYGGLVNVYADEIKQQFKYCSDSNGYWRYHRLEDFLEENKDEKVQVLLHPVWWTPEIMSPMERVERAISGRSECTRNQYVNALKFSNRKNISRQDV